MLVPEIFHSFGILRGVGWLVVTDVSGQHVSSIFKCQAVREEQTTSFTPRNIPEERRKPEFTHVWFLFSCFKFANVGTVCPQCGSLVV